MAGIPFVNDIDLRGNELLNARVPRLNGLPTATTDMNGWLVYNTQDDRYYFASAAAWRKLPADLDTLEGVTKAFLLNRTNHTGQQDSSTISDFHAAVIASRLDEFVAPTAAVPFGGQKITGLAAGTAGTDAVNKTQLDAVDAKASAAASGIAIKQAARVVSTANLAALSGLLTIDGVTLVAGNRVLVAGQTDATKNGIYVAASGAWARSTDADGAGELTSGTMIAITEGTANADTLWGVTSDSGSITIGTTAQAWGKLLASATGEIISAGNGLSKTGTTLAVVPKAGGKIIVDGSGVAVDQGVAGVSTRAEGSVPAGATSAAIAHNLGLRWVQVEFFETATGLRVYPNWTPTGVNAGTAEFKTAPTANQYTWSART